MMSQSMSSTANHAIQIGSEKKPTRRQDNSPLFACLEGLLVVGYDCGANALTFFLRVSQHSRPFLTRLNIGRDISVRTSLRKGWVTQMPFHTLILYLNANTSTVTSAARLGS